MKIVSHFLDCGLHRRGKDSGACFFCFIDNCIDMFTPYQRPDDVVDKDDFGVATDLAKPIIYAILASFAAGDNFYYLVSIKSVLPRITQGFYLAFTNNENNFTDLIVLGKTFNCVKEYGVTLNLQGRFFVNPRNG